MQITRYYYSPTTKGFYITSINPNIPEDGIELTEEKYKTLLTGLNNQQRLKKDMSLSPPCPGNFYDWNDELETWEYNLEKELNASIPTSITNAQARTALLRRGLLNQVENYIDSLRYQYKNDTTLTDEKRMSMQEFVLNWDLRGTFERNHEFIKGMAQLIGLDDNDVNELFIYATTL